MGSSVFVGKTVKVKIIYKYSPRGKTSALESLQNTNIFGIHTRKEENYFLKQAFARNKRAWHLNFAYRSHTDQEPHGIVPVFGTN